jgi:hypothetical protein
MHYSFSAKKTLAKIRALLANFIYGNSIATDKLSDCFVGEKMLQA